LYQLPLPGMETPAKITNVSQVPHRSPFRYPGGKTWFVPYLRQWLASSDGETHLIEPFAGGAIIGLTAAFEGLAEHVTLVELDADVAAVWQTIISDGEGQKLAKRILEFDLTTETVDNLLAHPPQTVHEHAFQTIVRNRVNRGGILAAGAGRVKSGENGKGITSRWYPETLAKRIYAIHQLRDRLTFINGDGLAIIEDHLNTPEVAFFVDPPYSVAGKRAGKRLYTHADIDHNRLYQQMSNCRGNFLMTYDNNKTVRQMTQKHGLMCRPIAMKNTHHARMTELIISNSLNWLS